MNESNLQKVKFKLFFKKLNIAKNLQKGKFNLFSIFKSRDKTEEEFWKSNIYNITVP